MTFIKIADWIPSGEEVDPFYITDIYSNPSLLALELIEEDIIYRNHSTDLFWNDLCMSPHFDYLVDKYNLNIQTMPRYFWASECSGVSMNPGAIQCIKKNLKKVNDLWYLSNNSAAVVLIEKTLKMKYVDWEWLSANPSAVHILERNLDKVDWKLLSGNPNAIHLIESNLNKVDWRELSKNPSAIHLLEDNLHRVDWRYLSMNPNAIHLLEKNVDRINWHNLSQNVNGLELIKANKHEKDIYWPFVRRNPNIFTYDYERIKWKNAQLHEDLMKELYKPERIAKFLQNGHDIEDLYNV